MGRLDIERFGGLGGFGQPGARVRSRGQIEIDDLAPADKRAVEALFEHPPGGGSHPDAFRYRLTRQTAQGPQSIEVPEQHVPQALRAIVKDELI